MQKMASKPAWELSSDYRVLLFNHWVMSNSLWSNGLQLARFLGPLVSPRVCSNSCPSSQWCYLTISSSAAPFSYCLQSFLQSRSFPMGQLFAPGGQSTSKCQHLLNHRESKGIPETYLLLLLLHWLKTFTVWITTKCGRFLKRWEY